MIRKVLRRFFSRLASLLGVPEVQSRLDAAEAEIAHLRTELGPLADHIERRLQELGRGLHEEVSLHLEGLTGQYAALTRDIESVSRDQRSLAEQQSAHYENRLMSLNDALVNYTDTRYEHLLSILENTTAELSARQASLRQGIDAIRMQSRTTDSDVAPLVSGQLSSEQLIDDALYVALENHFRGSRDLVAERQRSYLGELPSVVSAEHPVVDLGCGRGEWLQALQAQGIAARGVDSNTVCVAECRSAGLDVELSGIIQYLRNQPDHSVGAFTLFQVLEHLTFPVLLDTMRHARRVLVPGGRLIAEVPNAKNLRVAAGTFWIDPTHERPLYPEFLLFLAEEVGFTSARGVYANDSSPKFDLSSLPEGPREALQRVVDAIDTAGDFALIATA